MQVNGLSYVDGTPISVEISGKMISRVRRLPRGEWDGGVLYLAPGLIDNQVNGYVGIDFSGEELTVAGVREVTKALWREGVTSYLPTLISAPRERLKANLRVLAESARDERIGASIPGFHLEGPYISTLDGPRGAHNKTWIRPPDWQEFAELDEIADGRILQITLAPEVPGAVAFVEKCANAGKVVGLGHHNGSADEIRRAVEAGARLATHLGNAALNTIDRHQNHLWPQLADDRLKASLIVDGFHLRQEEVKVFFKVKGPDRLILISDATMFAGMPPGRYEWNDYLLVVTEDGMIKEPEQDVLAGASFPLRHGVTNMIRLTDCSLQQAIRMASENPAYLNGLLDRGKVKAGQRADLILFTYSGKELSVLKTIVAGEVVYDGAEKAIRDRHR